MIRLIGNLFHTVFEVAALCSCVGAVGFGIWVWLQSGGNLVLTVLAMLGAVLLIVLVTGLVAMQIENNQLLRRLVAAIESRPPENSSIGRKTSSIGPTATANSERPRIEPLLKR